MFDAYSSLIEDRPNLLILGRYGKGGRKEPVRGTLTFRGRMAGYPEKPLQEWSLFSGGQYMFGVGSEYTNGLGETFCRPQYKFHLRDVLEIAR